MIDVLSLEEQEALRDSVVRVAKRHRETGTDAPARLWSELGHGLGVIAIGITAASTGATCDRVVELALVGAALAEHGLDTPFIDSAVLCGPLIAALDTTEDSDELERLATGDAVWIFAAAEPGRRYALNAVDTEIIQDGSEILLSGAKMTTGSQPTTSGYLVTARLGGQPDRNVLVRVPGEGVPGVDARTFPTYDGTHKSVVSFSDVRLPRSAMLASTAAEWDTVIRAHDLAIATHSAQAVALMRRVLDQTLEYTKQRRQFGVAIGSFQVIQHRLVDMYMQVVQADAAVQQAQQALVQDAADIPAHVAAAKYTVARASRYVAENAVQLHGATGMTDGLGASRGFRRLVAMAGEYGTADEHLARYIAET